jgi:hypothetical protein
MTNVQMLVHITGGRADGSVWPQPGHVKPLKVSKAEAEDLYRAQLARPWPGGDEDEQTAEAAAAAQTEALVEAAVPPVQWPPDEPTRMGHNPNPEPAPVPEQPEEEGPPRPAATKAEWAEWSLKNGAQQEWVDAATKQQMMEQYGARP